MIVPDLIKAVEAGQEKARLEIQRKHHMNNRIRQLALQAGLKQRIWNSLGKELPMWQEDPDNPGLEKFAELIVRECINREELLGAIARGWCSEKNSHKTMDPDLALAIFDEVERQIKQQFGVE